MAKKKKTVTKKPKTPRFQNVKSFFGNRQTQTVFGFFLISFSLFLLIAFISFFFSWDIDQSELTEFSNKNSTVKNLLGKIGHSLSHTFIYKGFGVSAFVIPILLFFSGLFILFQVPLRKLRSSWSWGILGMVWFSTFFGFFTDKNSLLSGIVGYEVNDYLQQFFGNTGIIILLLFALLAYLAIRFGLTAHHITSLFKRKEKKEVLNDESVVEKELSIETSADKTILKNEDKSDFELSVENLKPTISNYLGKEDKKKKVEKEDISLDIKIKEEPNEEEVKIDVEKIVEEKTETENLSDKLIKDFGEFDPTLDLGTYKFPSLELLRAFNENISIDQEELEANKNKIVETLNNYKIGIAKIKATVGPTVTLYEIVPEAGVRISKIKNLEDDIALSLAALGIRIIAPIPGKGTIGIEVPNKNATIVSMKSMISSSKYQKSQMELPIAFGKTISNESFVVDLAKMPHLLMAGATGQGKSVGLNVVLTSL
jgi:S-DNA-T family DNA segregation ATPase FtsK/SpoIIIE